MACAQRVGHIAEGGLHGFFVMGYRHVGAYFGQVQVVAQPASGKDRQRDAGHEAPGPAAALEQAIELIAGATEHAGQRNAREEGRTRRTNLRLRGCQLVLGGDDVRALCQQGGGQAGSYRAQLQLAIQQAGARCQVHWTTGQQGQRMTVALTRLLQLLQQGLCLRQQRAHLGQLQQRAGTHLVAARIDAVRFLARADRLPCNLDTLVILALQQPGVRYFGHQADAQGALGGIGGQVVLQGGIAQVADAAPEIDFPAGHAQADAVAAGDHRLLAG